MAIGARRRPSTSRQWLAARRRGVNLTGMNVGDLSWHGGGFGPTRGTHYPTFSSALLNWFQTNGFGAVRIMFSWEGVQSALSGSVPPSGGTGYANYWADLTGTVTDLLSRGIYVSLSPWQYNPSSGDTDITYGGSSFTAAQFGDFWGKFAKAINLATGGDLRVAFDLINEPHTHAESGSRAGDIGVTLSNWSSASQAAITAIRAAGCTNTIFWPGMAYTAASSFTSNGSSTAFLALTDPANNLAVSVHCYDQFQAHSTSSTAHRDACSALVTWARTNKVLVQLGEIGADVNSNGVTTGQATATWADFESFQIANKDVCVGWCWWGNSASGWWAADDTHWGLTLDDGSTTTKYWTMIGSSIGTS